MFKTLKLIILSLLFSNLVVGQTGKLRIFVIDSNDKTPLVFVPIKIQKEGSQVKPNIDSAYTDGDGRAEIIQIDTGKYTIRAIYSGYYNYEIKGVRIEENTVIKLKIKMKQVSYHKAITVY